MTLTFKFMFLRWLVYTVTGRFATTIFSATQHWSNVATFWTNVAIMLLCFVALRPLRVFRQFQFTYMETRPRPRSRRIKSFNCELCRSVYFLDPFTVKTDQAFLRRIKLKLIILLFSSFFGLILFFSAEKL